MIDFTHADLFSVLPDNLKQPKTKALSAALAEGLRSLQYYSRAASLYASVEELPDEVLNLLAVELRTQYYHQSLKRKTREQMVKKTIAWYLRGGTASVLKEYLGMLYQGGALEEWHHYGGQPFYFKAIVDLALEDELLVGEGNQIIERIEAYKNVRSWLEALILRIPADYVVSVCYQNKIRFQTNFYPRYNLPYLFLDQTWLLNEERLLNGYDSEEIFDFYPVQLHVQTGASAFESGSETAGMSIRARICIGFQLEEKIKVRAEGKEKMQSEERLKLQAKNIYHLNNRTYMTKQNFLDAEWELNRSRKLDGGRYEL